MLIILLVSFLTFSLVLIYQNYILSTNFNNYRDFSDNRLSEIQGKLDELFYHKGCCELFVENFCAAIERHELCLDLITFQHHSHLKDNYHLDLQYNPVTYKPRLEYEFEIDKLETSVKKRCKELNIPLRCLRLEGK